MDCLRTPDERFQDLRDWPYEPHYTDVPDGEGGELRVHHVDVGAGPVVVCMHGQPTWSYLYRHMIPLLTKGGLRVIAPDLVGFGRSDKPSAREDFSYQRQVDWMGAWLRQNDIRDATLMAQDWGGLIGLRLVADHPERFDRVIVANTGLPASSSLDPERAQAVRDYFEDAPTPTLADMGRALSGRTDLPRERAFAVWQKWCWETEDLPIGMMIAATIHGRTLSGEEVAAYDAPFPSAAYKMGPRAMPKLVPSLPDDPALPAQRAAWEVLEGWTKPFICAFTDNDPVTVGADRAFLQRVPGAADQAHVTISGGGHFLQEGRAKELAAVILDAVPR